MTNFIARIRNSIIKSEVIITKQLLKELKDHPLETKLEVLQIFALAPDITALNLMPLLVQDEYADKEIHDRVVQLLIDRAHLNFHFSLVLYDTCDRDMILQIVPLMKHILSKETDFEILKKTIKTAGKHGIQALVADIAEFIFYDEVKLKAEAVKALEKIGSEDAYNNLLKAADSPKCDHDILNALVYLKKKKKEKPESKPLLKPVKKDLSIDISKLNENLKSKDMHTRFTSFSKLAAIGGEISGILSVNLESENHDLVVASLNLISRIIPKKLIPEVFSLLGKKKIDQKIKFAAYTALGAFPEMESVASVIKGISDSSMYIRIAAIKVLDKNPTDFVLAEINERIESGKDSGKKLGESILDAHADNIIIPLMVSDAFSYIISNYLEKKASFQAIENYIKIQRLRNLISSVKKYEKILIKKQVKGKPCIIIISSSKIRIRIYTKILFDSGFISKSFQSSQAAFESLMTEKPFGVICDLFLNNMTGLDLLKEIRDIHPKEELPIILSTLQKDFINEEQNIIAFPPNADQIHSNFKQR
jgi:CheY-like chemotaxis protein